MNLRKWTRIIIIVLSVATYLVTLGLEYDAYRIDLRTTQAQKELRRRAAIAELERRSVQAGGEIKEPFQIGGEVATPDIFDIVATEQLQKQKSPHFFEYLSQGTLIATGIVVALWIVYLILFWLIIWFYKAGNRQKRIRVLWLGISIIAFLGFGVLGIIDNIYDIFPYDDCWVFYIAAFVSFVAIWLVYWILYWIVQGYKKIGKEKVLKIIKWAVIIFFASILFHLADYVVHKTTRFFEEVDLKPKPIQFKFGPR